mgnify:FL=1
MSADDQHCTSEIKLLPALLKENGYFTVALGKWDIGDIVKKCTPTYSGFDAFLGYYEACLSDYWYHWAPHQCDKKGFGPDALPYVDFVNSSGVDNITPSSRALNGTYNAHIFTAEAIRHIDNTAAQPVATRTPLFLYLAYQNCHLACGSAPDNVAVLSGKKHGLNAPCGTVDLYSHLDNDQYKLQGAVVTELDYGVGNVTAALKRTGLWENTVLFLVSDNGAQLDHGYNWPLRGGKHTFWEGGVRVSSFLTSPLLPASIQGTKFNGMAHSSDWYVTLVEGLAGGNVSNSGERPSDGHNLWPAMLSGSASPRREVVHQVNNSFYNAMTGQSFDKDGNEVSKGDGDGSLGMAIRVDNWKLILGNPGQDTWKKFPTPMTTITKFGKTGGIHEAGTDHCRSPSGHTTGGPGPGTYLFDLSKDLNESHNLAKDPAHAALIATLTQRMVEAGKTGPPPAYVFMSKDAQKRGEDNECAATMKTGFVSPGDLFPPTPTPPGPSPPVPGPARDQCTKADGVLNSNGKFANVACCAATCVTCGGEFCNKRPGGKTSCCSKEVVNSGRVCTTDKAPCKVVL